MFQDVADARDLRERILRFRAEPDELEGLNAAERMQETIYINCPICHRIVGNHGDGLPCFRRNEWDKHGLHHPSVIESTRSNP